MINQLYKQININKQKDLSYHIVGVIGNKEQVGGTGFFIKIGEEFYLVSAWHNFSFKDYLSKTFVNDSYKFIKEIVVYRNLYDIHINQYLKIPLVDFTTNQPTYLSIFIDGNLFDISAIQVNRNSTFKFDYYEVNTVNNIVKKSVNDDIFYYGFPIKYGKQSDNAELFKGKITKIDNGKKEFEAKIEGYIGCSGSPCFIIIKEKVYLCGVLFYALKDTTGKAEYCKVVDLSILANELLN